MCLCRGVGGKLTFLHKHISSFAQWCSILCLLLLCCCAAVVVLISLVCFLTNRKTSVYFMHPAIHPSSSILHPFVYLHHIFSTKHMCRSLSVCLSVSVCVVSLVCVCACVFTLGFGLGDMSMSVGVLICQQNWGIAQKIM